jgi:hypothetical protein
LVSLDISLKIFQTNFPHDEDWRKAQGLKSPERSDWRVA